MANLKELVRRRKSATNTQKITRTMEMVATAKLKKAQQRAESNRPYARKLLDLLGRLAASGSGAEHPLMQAYDKIEHVRILLVTSDRGLCGAFNANIINPCMQTIHALQQEEKRVDLWCLGKKGAVTLRYRGRDASMQLDKVTDKPDFATAESVGSALIRDYLAGTIQQAILCYSRFESTAVQRGTVEILLPFSGKAPAGKREGREQAAGDYLFEPDPRRILDALVPMTVKTAIFTALLETSAGEHAARRAAMKNATDSADEMITFLTRQYNRARQGKITQEISEIVGAVEALG